MTLYHYSRKFLLLLLLTVPFSIWVSGQTASFNMPAAVCTNDPVTIANTSTGGTTYYWSFCSADLTQTPQVFSMSNLAVAPQEPVFIDVVEDNGNYYGFMTVHYPGNLIRLDFGNSLLNTPTATDFGNFGNALCPTYGTEGIQVEKVNGNWTALIVGGSSIDINPGESPRITKIDFGTNIANPAPVATNWGNIGSLQLPIQFYVFQENGQWHGFTVNSESSTLTRFDFGTDFTNPPTGVNLGNPGGMLNYPCGIYAVNDNGFWRVFISNGNINIPNAIVRLDFGSSLLNTPTAVNLGNPNNTIAGARAMVILQNCDQTVGFLTDGTNHSLVRLDFNNSLTNIPTATNLGNLANWNFPHSLSTLFRVGADLYSFVPDAFASTVTRLLFPGCNNSSIPSSTLVNPPSVSWSQPGTYRVNLTMDEGLPTQTAYCQSIVVGQGTPFSLGNDTALCSGDSLVLRYTGPPATFAWQNGSAQDTFTVYSAGQYSLAAIQSAGCIASDTINISYTTRPVVTTLPDTSICYGSAVQLTTQASPSDSIQWSPPAGLSSSSVVSPVATPDTTVSFVITAWNHQCAASDTVQVTVLSNPVLSATDDTIMCSGTTLQLSASGAASYSWYPAVGLSNSGIADPLASPAASQRYYVRGTGANSCTSLDSVQIIVKAPDVFSVTAQPAGVCPGDSSVLTVKGANPAAGDTYTWQAPGGLQDSHDSVVQVTPPASTTYEVVGTDKVCNRADTLTVNVGVLTKPTISLSKSNDIGCIYGEATLMATGDGIRYQWTPAETLSDPGSATPVARTDTTTHYWVTATGSNGCQAMDSITVFVSNTGGNIGFPAANAFTPNGDGHNDRFGLKYWGYIGEFQMNVFNRWGQLVFSSANPDEGWDGTFKGQPQPAGTYVYMIKATTLCGVAFKKGTVELIR